MTHINLNTSANLQPRFLSLGSHQARVCLIEPESRVVTRNNYSEDKYPYWHFFHHRPYFDVTWNLHQSKLWVWTFVQFVLFLGSTFYQQIDRLITIQRCCLHLQSKKSYHSSCMRFVVLTFYLALVAIFKFDLIFQVYLAES